MNSSVKKADRWRRYRYRDLEREINRLPFWYRNMGSRSVKPWDAHSSVFSCSSQQLCETCCGWKQVSPHNIVDTHTSLESSLFISSSKYESGRTSCRLALNARRCTLVRSLPLMSLSLSLFSGRYITSHVYYLGSITCPVWVKRRQGLLPVYLMHSTCPFHYIMHAMLTSSSLKLSSLCRIHDLYIFLTPSEHIYKNSKHVQEH